ncbi:STAS domain-containing protein [Mycolicibacter hiberniae]|uniref:Sulfate transporter n=1 Tax=Mycolicibacter hiberniae TaxID=29314 RepID=A0A7I7X432_9MYCO|nr:STAS domain-containing protein [Mycolicibacter hiberniae]MCV7085981.1 STAS domain-containing protein [Mycolicibacter hiberniae]ORV72023.1 sulfate transporter [Mycolicibacter hiberniae]BBZ24090.1 sulfate transporter [Mycolicibacter hiberniae]
MTVATAAGSCLLTAAGTLDSSTYLELRDCVIRAALAEPPAVVVDVSGLDVPASSAWSVFTSARWHVSTWPAIPILLVCPRPDVAAAIANAGVTRYLSVHADVESAVGSLTGGPLPRRRVHAVLPHRVSSLRGSRDFVAEWLTRWSQELLIPAAKVIVDVLVENVLRHTNSPVVVALESTSATITIAVHDNSAVPAIRHELATGGADRASGLAVVGALCRAWGSNPAPNGKTVWAVLGPENRL